MNSFDVFTLAVCLVCFYFGFKTGIITSIFCVASGFVGIWAAQTYAVKLGMNFYLMFLCSAAAVALLGFILGKIFRTFMLGIFDQIVGGLLGVLLALCIVGISVEPVSSKLTADMREIVSDSYSVKKIVPFFKPLYPRVKQFDIPGADKISLPALKEKLESSLVISSTTAEIPLHGLKGKQESSPAKASTTKSGK